MNAITKTLRHKVYVGFFLEYDSSSNNKKDLGAFVSWWFFLICTTEFIISG